MEFIQDILKAVRGADLQKDFDERLWQILCFHGLKLLNKLGQLKVITAADYRHVMKIVIFMLDDIFDEWNEIIYDEFCKLYAKFSEMYITSKQELFTKNDLIKFKVIISDD